MKTLLLLFLPVLASWCSGPKKMENLPAAKIDTIAQWGCEPLKANKQDTLPFAIKRQRGFIEFIDNKTNKVISVFNYIEKNPYNNLDFPVVGKEFGDNVYQYTPDNSYPADYFYSSMDEPDKYRDPETGDYFPIQLVSGSTGGTFIGKQVAVVAFTLTASEQYLVLGQHSTFFVLNSKGEVIHQLKHVDGNADIWGGLVATEDGRFIGYVTGGNMDDSGNELHHLAFRIYDFQQGKQLIEITLTGSQFARPILVGNSNLIRIEEITDGSDDIFRIIDPYKGLIYYRLFPHKSSDKKLRKITEEGFVYQMPDGHIVTEYYQTDFQIIKF